MNTPYDGQYVTASGEEILDNKSFSPFGLLHKGSAMPIVATDGSMNAHNVSELMKNMSLLMAQASAGNIQQQKATARAQMAERLERKQVLASALHSSDKDTQQALAEVMGEQIFESMGRSGFARKFMNVRPLTPGAIHQIPVIVPDVASVISNGSSVPEVQIRGQYIQPRAFEIIVNVLIDELELAVSPIDLLDLKYNQGLEQGMVGEDKVFVKQLNAACDIHNTTVYYDTLSPTILASIQSQIVTQGGIPLGGLLMAADIWADIIAETEFQNAFSPIEKHEIILSGRLGQLYGMDIVTDGFRIPTLKVLEQGQLFVLGAPDVLGEIGQYGAMTATAQDRKVVGEAKRGWFMQTSMTMAVANARAVVKGQRI